MQVARIISRNRKIPDRAAGYIFFVLKWPSGSIRDGYTMNIETAIVSKETSGQTYCWDLPHV